MIFSFSGAQSTGKTTLLTRLKEEYSNDFKFVPEVTRLVKREFNLPINENGNEITQHMICSMHMFNAYKKYNKPVILDRCSLDGLVYTKWLVDKKNLSSSCLSLSWDVFKKTIDKYSLIMYTSPEDVPIVDDGERSVDLKFREDIIKLFEHYLNCVPKDKVVRIKGTVEERLEQIKKIILCHN